MPDDLNFQRLSSVQSDKTAGVPTITGATTIAPTTFMTYVSGTFALTAITPPVSGPHMLVLIFTNASPAAMATTGNLIRSTTLTIQNVPYVFFYDNQLAKYYVNVAG